MSEGKINSLRMFRELAASLTEDQNLKWTKWDIFAALDEEGMCPTFFHKYFGVQAQVDQVGNLLRTWKDTDGSRYMGSIPYVDSLGEDAVYYRHRKWMIPDEFHRAFRLQVRGIKDDFRSARATHRKYNEILLAMGAEPISHEWKKEVQAELVN